MKLTTNQKLILVLPFLLILSTSVVFVTLANLFSEEIGYVLGFIFYWVIWCLLVPLLILKKTGIVSLFPEEHPLFRRPNWLAALVFIMIIVITIAMYPPTRLVSAPIKLLIIAVPIAIINGICEWLLWRGLYVKSFSSNPALGVVYPAIGFAFWHISPQLIIPAEIGIWPFVISTFFLGVSYGWISYRTGSIKWNAISHSIGGILDLGGAIAPSIFVLIVQ